MIVIRDPNSAADIANDEIRVLVTERMDAMSDGDEFDADLHGYFVIAEPNDTVAEIEQAVGMSLDMTEVVEQHSGFTELVYIPGDGDFGVVLIVPDAASQLLALST